MQCEVQNILKKMGLEQPSNFYIGSHNHNLSKNLEKVFKPDKAVVYPVVYVKSDNGLISDNLCSKLVDLVSSSSAPSLCSHHKSHKPHKSIKATTHKSKPKNLSLKKAK